MSALRQATKVSFNNGWLVTSLNITWRTAEPAFVACRSSAPQVARAAGLHAHQQARSYSLLDKLAKKTKEAVDK